MRTFLPCSGVGRHINGTLASLAEIESVELELLFAEQWQSEGGLLSRSCPLRDLPFKTFRGSERIRERLWKLTGRPYMDKHVATSVDWVFCPMDTRFPLRKTPVAITIHDVQALEPGLPWSHTAEQRRNRRRWHRWLPQALRESQVVFTVSEFSKRRMVELTGVPEEKVFISGNGVDPAFFQAGLQTRSMETFPYILAVGGLRIQKGGPALLAVARTLRKVCPEMRIVVAGLPHDPALLAEAGTLGGFEFPGMVPDGEMPLLMRDACCLIFLSPYEGFGMPPLEAMACGTPAIVAAEASLPEIVGDAAVVVRARDIGAITEAILAFANDGGLRARWGDSGRLRALGFSWQKVAERVRGTLDSAS